MVYVFMLEMCKYGIVFNCVLEIKSKIWFFLLVDFMIVGIVVWFVVYLVILDSFDGGI